MLHQSQCYVASVTVPCCISHSASVLWGFHYGVEDFIRKRLGLHEDLAGVEIGMPAKPPVSAKAR